MTAVVALCSVLTAAGAFLLLRRLHLAGSDAATRLASAGTGDDFPSRLLHLVRSGLEEVLLPSAGQGGLAEIAVRSREQRDPYRNVAELIDWLARAPVRSDFQETCAIIKAVYQLGHSLRAADAEVQSCLEPLIARIRSAKIGGSPVGRVECVRPGSLLDPGTMASLNYGARVTQPLGVLVYDLDGRVLGKAKVLCG